MSKALLRFVRLSPTKARLVAGEVQGMNVELALASLEFTPNKAAKLIAKTIASAVANGGYEPKNAIVYSCRVDAGPVLRRFMPRARGRATPIRKPTSHILVEVLSQSEVSSLQAKKSAKTASSTSIAGDDAKNKGEVRKSGAKQARVPVSKAKAQPESKAKKSETKDK